MSQLHVTRVKREFREIVTSEEVSEYVHVHVHTMFIFRVCSMGWECQTHSAMMLEGEMQNEDT